MLSEDRLRGAAEQIYIGSTGGAVAGRRGKSQQLHRYVPTYVDT